MTSATESIEMTEDEWIEKFKPVTEGDIKADEGDSPFYFDHHQLSGTPIEQVWTLVEDDEKLFVMSGYAMVNRIANIVCNVPREDAIVHIIVDYND